MTEEEAIKYIKIILRDKDIPDGVKTMSYVYAKEAIETVLNLLQTKQEEIDILKCNNEIMQGELNRIGIDTLKLELGSSTDDVIEEIKKKDKIINLMAEQLTTPVHSKEWVIEFYKKKVEEC